MALIDVPLNRLQLQDLQVLVVEEAREGRSLEFKQLVEGDDGAKREFLADVSSLANASGGDLVIGVRDEDGIATELVGIPRADADAETLRLENIVRDGLEPRLPGVQTRIIDLDQERAVLVIRVPRSWAGPHMVAFKGLSRFYSRNSAGKYQLDVGEIRAAFNSSQTAQAAVRDFRIERLSRITADQGGVPLLAGAKVVMHLIPLSVADGLGQVDLSPLIDGRHAAFRPLRASGWNTRINFEGAVTFAPGPNDEAPWSYTQIFRNGAIEGVDAFMLRARSGERDVIPSTALEEALIEALGRYLALLRDLDAAPPLVLATAYLGVRGFEMAVNQRYFESGVPVDRDDLLIPESLIESLDSDADVLLKPQLDALWNAVGFQGSTNYDEEGRWQSPR
jgi:Schlafen, AlbA_2